MQKRVLPPRSTRGQPPKLTAEQQEKDRLVYEQVFSEMQRDPEPEEQQNQGLLKELIRRQTMTSNIREFPYARGYHYCFNLDQFPRLQGSPSYACDTQNVFNSHYSHDNQAINDTTYGNILNRQFFGLPRAEEVRGDSRTHDKNICHSYLYVNEDKKYKLDQMIYQFRYILKNFDLLETQQKVNMFNILRKDFEISIIWSDPNMTLAEKKDLLKRRVSLLEERRLELQNSSKNEDKMYYYHSLNQKLHNEVTILDRQLSLDRLLSHLVLNDKILEDLCKGKGNSSSELRKKTLTKILIYNQSDLCCVSEKVIDALTSLKNVSRIFKQPKDANQDTQFMRFQVQQMLIPCQVFDFSNMKVFQRTEEVLSNRLYQNSDAMFYVGRSLWRKLFLRELTLKQKDKFIPREVYIQNATKDIEKIKTEKKQSKKQLNDNQLYSYPDLSQLVNFEAINAPQSEQVVVQKMIFKNKGGIQLNTKEFILLNLFHWLYKSLAQLDRFGISSNGVNFQSLLGSEFYVKVHHSLTEKVGTSRFGIIEEVMKKICDIMPQPGHTIELKIMFDYNADKKVAFLWTQEPDQEDWQTEREQQISEGMQQSDDEEQNSRPAQETDNDLRGGKEGQKPRKKVKKD